VIEGCETDYGFVPYSAKTLAYLDRHASRRNEPLRGRIGRERIAHLKTAERVASAVCVCAAIEFASSGKVLESF
jgi:hypothetical protein